MRQFHQLAIIIFALFFSSCGKNFPAYTIENNKAEFTILCLGDSYTVGEAVPVSQSFPFQLLQNLKTEDLITKGTYNLIAKTGWTTTELKEALQQNAVSSTYDIVTLLIGANNIFRNYPTEIYETEFEELLQAAIQKTGNQPEKVIVISIPDYGYTPFGKNNQAEISAKINAYNTINELLALQYGAQYVNITPISRKGLQQSYLITYDGLHPSGIMYAEWVAQIIDLAANVIE